ncbi:MAG: pyruvate dehydrogenase [Gammaproteobacteria bacterium]|nr:pyruvate dehydrogenase [Gammaproteobacteria bacterium]MBV9621672.1 pyruvate dehydrogenase [Gammaproteobacteria bacterium]
MALTVAAALVDALERVGVRQIFGLIGDSLNPFADAVQRTRIEWVGVRHEEGAALAAAGQAKLTGHLGVCCGTTGPGSTHLVAGLYEASRDHAPVLAISGEMARKDLGSDFIQTTAPDLLFRDVSLYTETLAAPEQAPVVIHQAVAAAYAGRGVAHLTIPQDVFEAKVDAQVPSVATLQPLGEVIPQPEAVAAAAARLDAATRVLILCGGGCRGATAELLALAERLNAPLIHTLKAKDLLPYEHPRWIGGIGMIGTRPAYDAAMRCDLLLMLGTDYPYAEYLPKKTTVIQVDERAQILGRRTPTELGIVGSVRPTVRLLLERIASKSDASFFEQVSAARRRWDAKLDAQADLGRSRDCIHPQAVARMVGDLARSDAVFVLDTGLNTLWSGNWLRQSGTQRITGSFNNAAVGTALGQANGIQALDRGRQVIALCGDGGFNMLMGELLTSVHHRLPVKVLVYNNGAFGLIPLEAEQSGLAAYRAGIEFPNPDYVTLARACGARGLRAERPAELRSVLEEGLASEGPTLIDCVVAAHEVPNVPHVDLEKLGHFALAKVKEALRSLAGR